jgi:large subunit ribosomal protein L29
MKIADIRSLSDNELTQRKQGAREEYFNLRLQQKTGALENPNRLRHLRRLVARIETVMSQRRGGFAAPAAASAGLEATASTKK